MIEFQHTATRRWLLDTVDLAFLLQIEFQHTATRRWLQNRTVWHNIAFLVSTHSHPKVAAIECKSL